MRHIQEPGTAPYDLRKGGETVGTAHRFLCGVFIPQSDARRQFEFEGAKRLLGRLPTLATAFCEDCLFCLAEREMKSEPTAEPEKI